MKFTEILGWLFIFIVGSLIVSFIIQPDSFDEFKNSVGNVISNVFSDKQTEKLNYSNYVKVNITTAFGMGSCSVIESLAEQEGMSGETNKKRLCTYYCGENNMEYGFYECKLDKFTCYCLID
jgi:hypothetical protein